MDCLTEFKCSVFADGELSGVELREAEEHLESCPSCRAMVAALREENRGLVHCIQEIDLLEVVPEAAARPVTAAAGPKDVLKLGGMLIGGATLVRLAMSSPENFALPSIPVSLEWLDPSNLSGALNWLVGSTVFAATEGVSRMASLMNSLSVVTLYVLIAAGVAMLMWRSIGKGVIGATLGTLGVVLLIFAGPPSSYAMDVRASGVNKNTVTVIPAGETIDDSLFVTGASVTIDGTVTGDLIAFARQVTVNGTVNGNIITAGQTVEIHGTVGGSIIAAGNSIQVNGKVTHNVLSFGQSIMIGKDGNVSGDAGLFGSDSHMNGNIAHSYYVFGATDIAGSIGRNVVFRGTTISVLPAARIGGDLTSHVQNPEAVRVDAGAVIGGRQSVDVSTPGPSRPSRYLTFSFYFSEMLHVAAAFIAGLILLVLFPGFGRVSFSEAAGVLKSAGIGFLGVVAMPIAALCLAITLIGLPVALFGFVAWMLGLYLAKIIIAVFVGRSLLSAQSERMSAVALNLFVGLMLIFVAINLPYVGGLVHALLILIGFGAMAMTLYDSYQASRGSGR